MVDRFQAIITFDQRYLELMEHIRTPILNTIAIVITHIGDPATLILLSVCILIWLWVKKKSFEIIVFSIAMATGSILVWLLKHLINRERPLGIIAETGYSFPSGHALVASIFFPLLIYILKRHFSQHIKFLWLKRVLVILGFVLMSAIILSRPYLGVHYLSDILAGTIIGLCISSFSILVLEGYYRKIKI